MVTLRCTACGREYHIKEYLNELSENDWDRISFRPCNRA